MMKKIKQLIEDIKNTCHAIQVFCTMTQIAQEDDKQINKELLKISKEHLLITTCNSKGPSIDIINANRRYDIAKTVLPAVLDVTADPETDEVKLNCEQSVKDALALADELIKQLNKK